MRTYPMIWRPQRPLSPAYYVCLLLVLGACADDDLAPTGPSEPDTVVHSIEVVPPERTIGILGTQAPTRAWALNEDGEWLYSAYRSPGRFSWSSSAPEVATVDEEALSVTGLSEGTATITATSQGVTGTMTVTVRDRARPAWSVPLSTEWLTSGITVGADGTVYVGSHHSSVDQSVWYALSPAGNVLWTLNLPYSASSTPAIGEDGTLYIGSRPHGGGHSGGHLIAVDPGGTVEWMVDGIDGVRSSPAIGPDGTIYAAGGRHLHAVDPTGEVQ